VCKCILTEYFHARVTKRHLVGNHIPQKIGNSEFHSIWQRKPVLCNYCTSWMARPALGVGRMLSSVGVQWLLVLGVLFVLTLCTVQHRRLVLPSRRLFRDRLLVCSLLKVCTYKKWRSFCVNMLCTVPLFSSCVCVIRLQLVLKVKHAPVITKLSKRNCKSNRWFTPTLCTFVVFVSVNTL